MFCSSRTPTGEAVAGWTLLTAALGPEDGDDGVGEAPGGETRRRREPLHRGAVHLSVGADHLRSVALGAIRRHGKESRGSKGSKRDASRGAEGGRGEGREAGDRWPRDGSEVFMLGVF